jgi:hypothetical protein
MGNSFEFSAFTVCLASKPAIPLGDLLAANLLTRSFKHRRVWLRRIALKLARPRDVSSAQFLLPLSPERIKRNGLTSSWAIMDLHAVSPPQF